MKAKTTVSRIEARKSLMASQLMELPKLESDEKMRLALQLACSTKKIERYIAGDVRKVQFAEVLLNAVKELINGKAISA